MKLTRGMRRFLYLLRDRHEGKSRMDRDSRLTTHEAKVVALADAGLIDLRITGEGLREIEAPVMKEACGGCDDET